VIPLWINSDFQLAVCSVLWEIVWISFVDWLSWIEHLVLRRWIDWSRLFCPLFHTTVLHVVLLYTLTTRSTSWNAKMFKSNCVCSYFSSMAILFSIIKNFLKNCFFSCSWHSRFYSFKSITDPMVRKWECSWTFLNACLW
jgi:hypothetical protein